MPRRLPILMSALALALATALPAQMVPTQGVLGLFYSAQELPVFTPEQLAGRHPILGNEPEAIAADQALNDWKICVNDALTRWSSLKPGVGTLVDGAYGRCADLERQYRDHLMRIAQGSRTLVDAQLARSLTRLLEDMWRPRLIATALDDELAHPPVLTASPPSGTPLSHPSR